MGSESSLLYAILFFRLLAFEGGFPSSCISIMEAQGGLGWTHSIASSLGASESGLRLVRILSILANNSLSIPDWCWASLLAILSCYSTEDISPTKTLILNICISSSQVRTGTALVKSYLSLFSGLLLAYWVIGDGVTHSLYTILLTYVTLLCLGGSIAAVSVTFCFNMFYLLAGYW